MSAVLVTGAAGFLGTALVRRLVVDGVGVVAADKAGMEHLPACVERLSWDITAKDSGIAAQLTGHGIGGCVHLAAIAAPRQAAADPITAWDTNVRGTYNVLSILREVGVRKVVFASSAHVYGISPRYLPTDENHPLALYDVYTTTKIMGEQLCRLFHANYGLSPTVLRLFNAYGPGQSKDYFMGVKLAQAQSRQSVTLMNAEVTKDWVFVDDVVEAIVRALKTEFVGPINVGTGTENNLAYIARKIAAAFDVPLVPDTTRDDSPTRMCCNPRRAQDMLGWRAQVSLEEGLQRLIDDSRVRR